MQFNSTQNEILKAVFRHMDQELGIKPLTEEQMQELNLNLEDQDEDNEQV